MYVCMCFEFLIFSSDHYHDVADQYDALTAVFHSNYLPVMQEALQLKPDDVVVDIGGGTGWYAHQLWKAAGLKEPVVCVDPSGVMLEAAKLREGVTGVQASAEEFFSRSQEKLFTKAFIIQTVHHFHNPEAVFKGIYNSLSPGGSCVIQAHLPKPGHDTPLFRAAWVLTAKSNVMNEEELTSLIAVGAPFEIHKKKIKIQHKIPKREWYKMIRGRYSSVLHQLNDQEIENGIKELEREKFQALRDDDPVTINDFALIIVAKKGL